MEEKIRNLFQNKMFRLIWLVIGIYISMKFLVPLFFPFLAAGFLAWLFLPFICFLHQKLKIGKGFLAAFLLITLGGIFAFLLWILMEKGLDVCREFLCNLDLYKDNICFCLKDITGYLERRVGIDAEFLEIAAMDNANNLVNHIQITYLPKIMDHSLTYLANIGKVLGTLFITMLATVFLIHDYDLIREKCRQVPCFVKIFAGMRRITDMLARYFKAQFLIFLVISGICIVSLFLCRSSFSIPGGLLAGLMDSLPFVGTGIILFPWALVDFIKGDYISAVIKIAAYLLCFVVREIMEPKLLGKKMGVFPVAMVMAVYIGIRIYGISGIIMGPISLLLIVDWLKN